MEVNRPGLVAVHPSPRADLPMFRHWLVTVWPLPLYFVYVCRTTIYLLLFADDQLLIAQDYEDLEYMTRKLIDEYELWVLKLNVKNQIHGHRRHINPLKTKRRLLYLKTQFVPRSKHFSSRL